MPRSRFRAAGAAPRTLALAAGLALSSWVACAASGDESPAPTSEPPAAAGTPAGPGRTDPLWELGVASLAAWQPAYPGSDEHLSQARLLPWANYRGRILRVENGMVGLRALRTPRTEWGLSGAFAFGGGASGTGARRGMPGIGSLVEFGPMLRVNLGPLDAGPEEARATRLELPLRAVLDVSDHFALRGWSFEPRLAQTVWAQGPSRLTASVSALVGDRSLNRVFYEVTPDQATALRPAFDARAGLVATRLGLLFNHNLNDRWRLFAFAGGETVRGAANVASPLVRSRQDMGAGLGVTWSFWHSEAQAKD